MSTSRNDPDWVLYYRESRAGFVLRVAYSLAVAGFFSLIGLFGLVALSAIALRLLGLLPPQGALDATSLLTALLAPLFAWWALSWLWDTVTDVLIRPVTYEGVADEIWEYKASGQRIDYPMIAIRSGAERWDLYRRDFSRHPGGAEVGRPIRVRCRRHSRSTVAIWFRRPAISRD